MAEGRAVACPFSSKSWSRKASTPRRAAVNPQRLVQHLGEIKGKRRQHLIWKTRHAGPP
jgi:hypothetical protein